MISESVARRQQEEANLLDREDIVVPIGYRKRKGKTCRRRCYLEVDNLGNSPPVIPHQLRSSEDLTPGKRLGGGHDRVS